MSINQSRNRNSSGKGFTLVELLVVIAIIGILASLLLPTLVRSREKARMTQCLSNFHQLGAALAMYIHDENDSLPGLESSTFTIGGYNPQSNRFPCLPAAEDRPLYQYIKPSEVFHCPKDYGIIFSGPPCFPFSSAQFEPTCWETAGCSYGYNGFSPGIFFKFTPEPHTGPAGQKATTISDPSRFILMYEPPATGWGQPPLPTSFFTHWHNVSRRKQTLVGDVADDPQLFISPILFVDGHAARFDFTSNIRADPYYANEPTKDWVWYVPHIPSPPP